MISRKELSATRATKARLIEIIRSLSQSLALLQADRGWAFHAPITRLLSEARNQAEFELSGFELALKLAADFDLEGGQ